ncbi:uncharacterized protein NECHADRAFT_80145 [Fusarium vanettenii 77-13-4]|uniref:Heterokaryon incompatibility domain-containing protein n=1 Tax=Fusarium vanettenii (strain ATCC MYA-4622 / CBS 123669 / FGSC 9596 / NRRL 45880 / 77-13-4) TaxID=660122 RepID=C7Z182_FUSV7|nr:uncharacterized protein NECHADRAFT_80145 [Fusarium vanettenii 77-13-4]EEU42527.1 hypothetical protein NECHADRAFT_80145 [Fusarium vanettenii 77-13-4]
MPPPCFCQDCASLIEPHIKQKGIVSDGALQLARKCWEWMDSHIEGNPAERTALMRCFSHNDKGEPAMELYELLGGCHSLVSSNPKDKIYAFLGMAKDRQQLGITPQYSLTDRQVYIDTAARILKNAHSLYLLSDVLPSKAIDLPNWVPDWSSRNFDDGNTVVYASITHGEEQYQADGHQCAQVRFNNDDTEFTTQGIIFDQLCLILPADNCGQHNPTYPEVVESSSAAEETFYALIGNVQTILESVCERLGVNAYLGKGGMKEAFWRTLVLNSSDLGNKEARPEYESYYDAQVELQGARFMEECGHKVPGVDEEVIVKAIRFANAMKRTSHLRPIGLTWRGYIGSVPKNSRVNDEVCILRGGRAPFILRRLDQGSRFSLAMPMSMAS